MRGWPSLVRRWTANPLVSDLGSSNLPPRVNFSAAEEQRIKELHEMMPESKLHTTKKHKY